VLMLLPILLYIDRHTGQKRHEKLVYAISGAIALAGVYWLLQRLGLIPG
jgi:hypothetical protein